MSQAAVQILRLLAQADTAEFKKVADSLDDVDRKATKATDSGGKLGSALGTAGKVAVGVAAGGIAAVGYGMFEATKKAADFQQSLANVGSVTGATKDEMGLLRDEALKVGRDTSKSASESVLAFGELLKAGMTVKDVVGGAGRTVVNLAEATGKPIEEMAVLLSNSLNTFGLGADQAGNVANTLARAANASAIDVSDLAQSLQAVGPVASQSGLTMDDFATAMGILGNNALKGSDAGTSLKTMLLSLTAPTDKAKALMEAYGISVFDAEGKTRPFKDIIGDLQGAMGDMSEEARASFSKDVFGTDAIRAANILVGEGVEGWDKFGQAMAEAPTVAEMSATRLNTLQGRIEKLKGALETAAILIGEKAIPVLTKLADGALKLADHLEKVDWKATLQPLAEFLNEKAKPALEQFIRVATDIVDTVRERWPQILATIKPVVDTIIDAFTSIANEVRPTIEAIVHHVEWLVGEIKERWDRLEPIITPIIEFITTQVVERINILANAIKLVMNVIQGDWEGAWNNVKAIGESVWKLILSFVKLAIEGIPAILNLGFDLIKDAAQLGWEAVKKLAEVAWDGIKKLIEEKQDDVIALVKSLPGKIKDSAGNFLTVLSGLGGDLIDGIIQGIKDAAGRLVSAAKGAVGDAIDGMKDRLKIFSPSRVTADEIGKPMAEGIGEGFEQALAGIDFYEALRNRLVAERAALIAEGEAAGEDTGLAFLRGLQNSLVAQRNAALLSTPEGIQAFAATANPAIAAFLASVGGGPRPEGDITYTSPETGFIWTNGQWQQFSAVISRAGQAAEVLAEGATLAAVALNVTAQAAMDAAQAQGRATSSSQNPSGTNQITANRIDDYADIAGLTLESVTENGITTNSWGFSADILAAYGGNLDQLMYDLERRRGRFANLPQRDAGGLITTPSILVSANSGVPYAMVAERRPELLMSGAATGAMLSGGPGGAGSGDITVQMTMDARVFAEVTFDARQLVDGARLEARMVG